MHALRHSLANEVYNCDSRNLGAQLFNPATGRHVKICEFRPGEWGRLVVENDNQTGVTSFANGEAKRNTLAKTVENLYRQGYKTVEYVRPDLVDRIIEIVVKMMVAAP